MDLVPHVSSMVKSIVTLISQYNGSKEAESKLKEALDKFETFKIANESRDKMLQELQKEVSVLKTTLSAENKQKMENGDDLDSICKRLNALTTLNSSVAALSTSDEYRGHPLVKEAVVNPSRSVPSQLPLAQQAPLFRPMGGMAIAPRFGGQQYLSNGPSGLRNPQMYQNNYTPNVYLQPNMNSWSSNQINEYRQPPPHPSYYQQPFIHQAPSNIMLPSIRGSFNQSPPWHAGATPTIMNGGHALQSQTHAHSLPIPNQNTIRNNIEKKNTDYKNPVVLYNKSDDARCFNSNQSVSRNDPKETRSRSTNVNNEHMIFKGQRSNSECTRNPSVNFSNEKMHSREKRNLSKDRRNNWKQDNKNVGSRKEEDKLGERWSHSRNRNQIKESHLSSHLSVAHNQVFQMQNKLTQASCKTFSTQHQLENVSEDLQTGANGIKSRKNSTQSSKNHEHSFTKGETSNPPALCSNPNILKKFIGYKVISEHQALAEGIDLNQSVHIIVMKNDHGEIFNPKTLRDIINYKKKYPTALSYSTVCID